MQSLVTTNETTTTTRVIAAIAQTELEPIEYASSMTSTFHQDELDDGTY